MNETLTLEGGVLCIDCCDQALKEGEYTQEDISDQHDSTVCANCQKDNDQTAFEELAGLPICPECQHFFYHRPFPQWIKTALVGVILLVLVSLGWNMRFIRGYIDLRQSFKCLEQGDLLAASDYMFSVSRRVPRFQETYIMGSLYKGIYLLQQDKPQEALDSFKVCRGKVPPDVELDALIRNAEIAVAFDNKDYDGFLAITLQSLEDTPHESFAIASVASAFACKYAATGDEKFKQQSLEKLKQAGNLSQGDEVHKEYAQRILHRLHSREIITREQFYEKFPDGWQPPAE